MNRSETETQTQEMLETLQFAFCFLLILSCMWLIG